MQIATEKQQKRHQQSLESLVRNRWRYTGLYALLTGLNLQTIFEKRSQWSSLFLPSITTGIPLWHHIWVNILSVVMFPLLIANLWMRVHHIRREQVLAEQEALQKTEPPPERVWPPPPVSET